MSRDTTVAAQCNVCNKLFFMKVNEADLAAWKHDTLVQHAFPYLSAAERDLLILGICGSCFDLLFPEED